MTLLLMSKVSITLHQYALITETDLAVEKDNKILIS